MRRLIVLFVLQLILFVSLAQAVPSPGPFKLIQEKADPFKPNEIVFRTSPILLAQPGTAFFYIAPELVIDTLAMTESWWLVFMHSGPSWLTLDSMTLSVDGQISQLVPPVPSTQTTHKNLFGTVYDEEMRARVDESLIAKIAGAKQAFLRCNSLTKFEDPPLKSKNVERLGKFLVYARSNRVVYASGRTFTVTPVAVPIYRQPLMSLATGEKSVSSTNELDGYKVKRTTDKFRPHLIDFKGDMLAFTENLKLMPTYVYHDSLKQSFYYWYIYYSGKDWVWLDRVEIWIDGNIRKFSDETPYRDTGSGTGLVFETLALKVDEDLYKELGLAKSVTIRVSGKYENFDKDLDAITLGCIEKFNSVVKHARVDIASDGLPSKK